MRGLRSAIAVTTAVTLSLGSGAASAKPPNLVAVQSHPTTVSGANAVGFANATCPKGTRAVSGGYRIAPPPSTGGGTPIPVVFESRGAPRGWTVGMANLTAGTITLRSYVYCRTKKPRLKEVSGIASLPPAPRSEATAVATCPKGMKVFSGGFHTPGALTGAFTYLTNLGPSGARSWSVTALRNEVAPQGGAAVPIQAFAYCGRNRGGVVKAATFTATSSPGDVYLAATTARCPESRLATGGGFVAPFAQTGSIRESTLVTELRRTGRRWHARGLVLGSSGLSLSLTAFTLCR